MPIAYTMSDEAARVDPLLADLAGTLRRQGFSLSGIVQINSDRPDGAPCDMDVTVLPAGPVLRISRFRGRAARGCRLDASSFETAVGLVDASLQSTTDLLILNKFGKQEALGRGMRETIARAVDLGIPVLLGLNPMNLDPFLEFTGGEATRLPARAGPLLDWCDAHCTGRGTIPPEHPAHAAL